MKWKITWAGTDTTTIVEADALDIEYGCLIFERGKFVKDRVVVLMINRDLWVTVGEHKEKTP